jgi:AcrR family transcriptional regulator
MAMNARMPRPRRDEVRSRVLAAAATVFAQRGFSGASIDEIAAEAGFTKGAVYSNFASKDELFLALMDVEVKARVDRVLANASTDQRAAIAIGDRLAQVSMEQPDWQLLFLEFWLRAIREPVVREQFVAHRRALRASIAEAIRQAFAGDEGSWTWSAEELTVLVLALSNGLAIEALADPTGVPDGLFGRALDRLVEV